MDGGQWFTRAGFAPAYVIPTNPLLSTEAPPDQQIRWAPSVTLEIGRQTDGSREWHHLYGLPSYGVGVSLASIGSGTQAGRPVDAYTFFSWPFARPSERVHVTTDIGMGLSWNWHEHDQQTNSIRRVLSSDMNVRVDWGFYLRYRASSQTSLYAGIDYTHRSNGGTRQPDEGINVIGPSVALRYSLTPEHRALPIRYPPPFRPAWEIVVGGLGGVKHVMATGNPAVQHDFGVVGATAGLQRQFYRYGKIAGGVDATYDGGAGASVEMIDGALVPRRGEPGDRLSLGLYGGYEHVIGRFGALVQAGYKAVDGFDDPSHPRLYGRYGWRYQFTDRLWGMFAVRAIEGRKADFIEFGAGYRMRWQ